MDENNVSSSEKYGIDIEIDDKSYLNSIDEIKDANKQLEGQLNLTASAIESNNKQYKKAERELENLVKVLNKYVDVSSKSSNNSFINSLGIDSNTSSIINDINKNIDELNSKIKEYSKGVNRANKGTKINNNIQKEKDRNKQLIDDASVTLSKLINEYLNKGIRGVNKKLAANLNISDLLSIYEKAIKDVKGFASLHSKLKGNSSGKADGVLDIASLFMKSTGKNGASDGLKLLGSAGVSEGSAGIIAMLSKLAAAGAIIAAVTASLALLYKGGKKASETTLQLSQQIIQFGSSLNEVSNKAIQASNKADAIKNRFSSLGDSMLSLLEPVYNGFIDLLDKFTAGVGSIREYEKAVGDLDSELLKAARAFSEGQSNVPIKQSLSAMRSTASYAQQSGFSNDSAQNLAIGTFNLADMLALRYGEVDNVTTIADQLTKAIMSGSDAAKDFGIVLNDEVLYGWLAMEKDIDAVNVKLSDAAMQAYRYELAMYEVGQQGSNTLQNQIKQWKQYGMQIQATQGQLLGFEKVVTLSGLDTTIPEIDKPIIGSTESANNAGPIVFGAGDTTPTSPLPGTLPSEVNIPVNLTNGEQVELDVPDAVDVKVSFPGLQESLNQLHEANSLIDTIHSKQPVQVDVKTNVETNTEESEVNVTRLIELYKSLPTGIKVLINTLFPGIGLLASGAQLLEWFTKNTDIGINLKVFGTDLIQKVSSILLDIIYKIDDIGNSKFFQTLGGFFTSKKTQRAVAFGSTAVLAGAAGAGAAVSSGLIGSGATAGTAAKTASSTVVTFSPELLKFINSVPKAADGGISTKHHLTSISENNAREAIIPLNSRSAQPAYQEMGRAIANELNGLGGNNTNVKVDLNVGVLTGDKNAARQLAIQIENEIARLQAQRGRLNYGIR